MKNKGFTLIELLVVIAIIGLLSSVVLASLNTAREKSRDARRKSDLYQLAKAVELRYDDTGAYPASAGWLSNTGHGGLDAALTPNYIPIITDDPSGRSGMYWRKDYRGYGCLSSGSSDEFAFYANLENPTASDLATLSDSFDLCVQSVWNMNYKIGN